MGGCVGFGDTGFSMAYETAGFRVPCQTGFSETGFVIATVENRLCYRFPVSFGFSMEGKKLQADVERLAMSFMRDTNNVMVCVEQAGDASTMSTLARCRITLPTLGPSGLSVCWVPRRQF